MIFIHTHYVSDMCSTTQGFKNTLLIPFFFSNRRISNIILSLLYLSPNYLTCYQEKLSIFSIFCSLICCNMQFLIRQAQHVIQRVKHQSSPLSPSIYILKKVSSSVTSDTQVITLILFTIHNQKYRKLALEFHRLQKRVTLISPSILFLCFPSNNNRKI